jgi:hypothetical protein
MYLANLTLNVKLDLGIIFLLDREEVSSSGKLFLQSSKCSTSAVVVLSSQLNNDDDDRLKTLKNLSKNVLVVESKLFKEDPLKLRQENCLIPSFNNHLFGTKNTEPLSQLILKLLGIIFLLKF